MGNESIARDEWAGVGRSREHGDRRWERLGLECNRDGRFDNHQRNGNASGQRHRGWQCADGDWIFDAWSFLEFHWNRRRVDRDSVGRHQQCWDWCRESGDRAGTDESNDS